MSGDGCTSSSARAMFERSLEPVRRMILASDSHSKQVKAMSKSGRHCRSRSASAICSASLSNALHNSINSTPSRFLPLPSHPHPQYVTRKMAKQQSLAVRKEGEKRDSLHRRLTVH